MAGVEGCVGLGATDGIQQLMKCGADPCLECSPGITALTLGASQGQTESVRILVNAGVDVDHETSIPGNQSVHLKAIVMNQAGLQVQ